MLDREACQRRVYRLALLLTGRPASAAAVIEQVLGIQPDLRSMDSAHMDRLTVLRSREQPSGPLELDDVTAEATAALSGLAAQQREAWVFTSLYGLDDRSAARAMDCSYTAVQRHREQAESHLRRQLGEQAATVRAAVRDALLRVDVPAFVRAAQRRRQRARRVVIMALVVLGVLGVLAAISWLARQVG